MSSDDASNQYITEERIAMVRRQTDYDRDTIVEKLLSNKGDVVAIIMQYNNVDLEEKNKSNEETLSTNQKIFKGIREFFA